MSAEDENPPAPNWLLKLEEQRVHRLKGRLGHEAGAGAPCQKCGDKCPGLDLHFWRKICKLCKCGKEDHDISDDDLYGFVQFQLLGSKPVKCKGILLKGLKDEVILEFTPKGASNDVKKYLDELPTDLIPVKGSEAAKLRKQRLQKQMPAHDIDASLCHALTPEEIKELEEYVAHIRKHSVGQGKIIRLSIFKGQQHKFTDPNAHFLTQYPPAQVASSQTVYLQSSDLANNLHNLTLREKTPNRTAFLNSQMPTDNIVNTINDLNPTLVPKPIDLTYSAESTVTNLRNNSEYPNYAPQSLHLIGDTQNPVATGKVIDLPYETSGNVNKLSANYPQTCVNPPVFEQTPQLTQDTTIQYPLTLSNVERHQEQFENPNFELNNANVDRVLSPQLNYAPNFVNPIEQEQIPFKVGQTKDLKYPNAPNSKFPSNPSNFNTVVPTKDDKYHPNNYVPYMVPTQDPKYPQINQANIEKLTGPNVVSNLSFNANFVAPIEQSQIPTQIGQIKDLKFPLNTNEVAPFVNLDSYPHKGPSIPTSQVPKSGSLHSDAFNNANLDPYNAMPGIAPDLKYPGYSEQPFSKFPDQVPKTGHLLNLNSEALSNANLDPYNQVPISGGLVKDLKYPVYSDPNYPGLHGQNQVLNSKLSGINYPENTNQLLNQGKESKYPMPDLNIQGSNPQFPGYPIITSAPPLDTKYQTQELNIHNPGHKYPDNTNLLDPRYQNQDSNIRGNSNFSGYPKNANQHLHQDKDAKYQIQDPNIQGTQFSEYPENLKDPNYSLQNAKPSNQFSGYPDNANQQFKDPNFPRNAPNYHPNDPNYAMRDPNSKFSGYPDNANFQLNDPKQTNVSNNTQFPGYPDNANTQLKDPKYPMQDLKSQDFQNRPQIPVLQAQSAINPFETEQNLTSVGYIQDINYPLGQIPPGVPTSDPYDIVNSNSVIPSCHECKEIFDDGSVAVSADRTLNLWHAKCFNCHTCKQPLADLLYFYHKDTDNIYCGRDYAILKGIPRCAACDELIFVREYCLAEDSTFHIKHFCCFECDEPLAGNSYVMENNQPVCVTCYENLKAEKCNDCGYVIRPDQKGVSLQNLHWHAEPKCFACKFCRKSLFESKMLLRNQQLFCSDVCFKTFR